MIKPEKLPQIKAGFGRHNNLSGQKNVLLKISDCEKMKASSLDMLSSIEDRITVGLKEMLREKINRESALFMEFIGFEERTAQDDAKRNNFLNTAYFIKRRLDSDILE